jgi:hypothetical protein
MVKQHSVFEQRSTMSVDVDVDNQYIAIFALRTLTAFYHECRVHIHVHTVKVKSCRATACRQERDTEPTSNTTGNPGGNDGRG